MPLGNFLLGLVDMFIVVVLLLVVGATVESGILNYPDLVRSIYLALIGLLAFYMLTALVLGAPAVRIFGDAGVILIT
jgi:hypothetical protein